MQYIWQNIRFKIGKATAPYVWPHNQFSQWFFSFNEFLQNREVLSMFSRSDIVSKTFPCIRFCILCIT